MILTRSSTTCTVRGAIIPTHDMIKNEAQIAGIRESAKINVAVLDYVAAHIRAGISTAEIDRWVYEQTTATGGIPAPLNYEGFPKSVCTSIDDQVCHGIPSEDGHSLRRRYHQRRLLHHSTTAIIPIPPACSSSAKPRRRKRSSWRSRASACMAGLEQVKPWGLSGRHGRRPCMIWPRRTVTASCATSAATAWACSSTKSPGSAM